MLSALHKKGNFTVPRVKGDNWKSSRLKYIYCRTGFFDKKMKEFQLTAPGSLASSKSQLMPYICLRANWLANIWVLQKYPKKNLFVPLQSEIPTWNKGNRLYTRNSDNYSHVSYSISHPVTRSERVDSCEAPPASIRPCMCARICLAWSQLLEPGLMS